MAPFILLADPLTYVATDRNLSVDENGRAYWCELFKLHQLTILALGVEMGVARNASLLDMETRTARCVADFHEQIDAFAARPTDFGHVTILTLDEWRDQTLARHGFTDPFLDLKNRENERMLPLLPIVCAQLDNISSESDRFRAAIEGVFAGNIFDMGSTATAKAFLKGSPDFFMIRSTLAPRPWLIDHYDALAARILTKVPHKKLVFFIDNAGSDFLLGALPLMRLLARRGTKIIIAANEQPSLNDMTIHDVRNWWPRILQAEPSFNALQIDLVSTGTGAPLIDLSEVSDELNSAAQDADLVILEGMGRGVESNLDAQFKVDSVNIAMLKDPDVAKNLNGKLFDLILRFCPA